VRVRGFILAAALCLPACSSGGANHIGNPLTLPGRAITHSISEAGYKARRYRVKDFVKRNLAGMHGDIQLGGGANLTTAMDLACIPEDRRAKLIAELRSDPALYAISDIEPLVVTLMVHGE